VCNWFAAQMARFTETGAFTGADARPLRKSAALPGVVGPDEGKEPAAARLIAVAAIRTMQLVNNFRRAILTFTSISDCDVLAGFSFKNRRDRQAQSSGAKLQGAAIYKSPFFDGLGDRDALDTAMRQASQHGASFFAEARSPFPGPG
jgi:hypothetical protein